MSKYIVQKQVQLKSQHKPTGKTRHYTDGEEVRNVAVLKIAIFEGDEGYYLLYFDKNGNELTDTYHETLEEALSQAEWEYGVSPSDWES